MLKGKTILLASHSREDIAILCDTVTEMEAGRAQRKEGIQPEPPIAPEA